MEAQVESRIRGRSGSSHGGGLRGALWLAAEDVRRSWISYPATCIVLLLVGFFAISLVEGVFVLGGIGEGDRIIQERFNGFVADTFFLAICPALGINFFFNRDYGARYRYDNMTRRLSFVKSLAVSSGEIVTGRALTMLLAVAVATPSFFLPLLLVSPGPLERLDIVGFLGFATIWVGYALFVVGFYMYTWLGFTGEEDLKITLVLALCYPALAALVNFVFDVHLVSGSIEVARTDGPFVGILALAAGAACFFLWGLATTRKLRRRDLSA